MMIAKSYAATPARPHLEAADLALTPILSLLAIAAILFGAALVGAGITLGILAGACVIAACAFFVAPQTSQVPTDA